MQFNPMSSKRDDDQPAEGAAVVSFAEARDGRPTDDVWPVHAEADSTNVSVLHLSVLAALDHLGGTRDGSLPTTTVELFGRRRCWTELPEAHPTVAGVILDAVRSQPVDSVLEQAA
jgi:hypothetical protein